MAVRVSPALHAAQRFAESFSSSAARSTAMSASAEPFDFARRLIAWQQGHGRSDLPWQSPAGDPYRIWVSEVMLQQTQVQTVLPYFLRFMQRFPDVHALARAQEQDVLALWAGLGYYHRGRNLLACARRIVDTHGGRFPTNAAELATLPGIGPSTAAAIASLAFGERAAILDGNVKRVLARQVCAEEPWASPALERRLLIEADRRLPQTSAEMPAYTQAIMDLGAMVCLPRVPQCHRCPVADSCAAHQQGRSADYPRPRPARTVPQMEVFWCLPIGPAGPWLVQQPGEGLWPGLWLPWSLDLQRMPADWVRTVASLREVIPMRHALTHRRLQISVGVLDWSAPEPPSGAPSAITLHRWDDALMLPVPAPVRRLLLRLCPFAPVSDAAPHTKNRF
jgi:A/G-specific adenine glycosylase